MHQSLTKWIFLSTFILWSCESYQFVGPSDQPEAFFNGTSYIRLQTILYLKRLTSFSFRSCLGGELFSQKHNNNVINLVVNAEGVVFGIKTTERTEVKLKGNFLDNHWHTVYLNYRMGNLTVSIDRKIAVLANDTYNTDLLHNSDFYNEGAILIVGNHYSGCILEGPSFTFNSSLIQPHNVYFGKCPLSSTNCAVRDDLKAGRSIDYCLHEPCMRQGVCVNGQGTYTCICAPRYSGKNCEIDLGSPCEKHPNLCKNGGSCLEDLRGSYKCSCPTGFLGKNCELEVTLHPQCIPNPCYNNGMCTVSPGTSRIECICEPGFTGAQCEININDCQYSPCLNDGICHDGANNYSCDCTNTGYKGRNCEMNINECLQNPCMNSGTCFDTYGSYTCQCLPGFEGNNCQFPVRECLSQPCRNNGQCVDKLGAYECHCPSEYTGLQCELEVQNTQCVDGDCSFDNPCTTNPCHNGGNCRLYKNSFNCSCPPGFTGFACEHLDVCGSTSPCRNGGSCVEHGNLFLCVCPEEFTGAECERRLNCDDVPCQHATNCVDVENGYYCICERGWNGLNCDVNIDKCVSNHCQNGGTCVNAINSFSCTCPIGFTGKFCQVDIDECLSNPCLNGGSCIDRPNGYYCNCTDQWMGIHCEHPFDICETVPCFNNGSCRSAPNKHDFMCECQQGYEGQKCEVDVDECIDAVCPKGYMCLDLIGNYECVCPEGYSGENCTILENPCVTHPCVNGSTCTVDKISKNFTCHCPKGYTGRSCNEDVNECDYPGICNHGICVNKPGSFQCYCMPGYTGEACDLDFDECLSHPCRNEATCINKVNNFACICPPGYTGKDCSININECDSMPCVSGSTCIDGINEFTCICQPGLTGKLCNINIDDCESSPCLNGAACIDGLNSFTCNCNNTGFTGERCEKNIDDCIGNPCENGGICQDGIKDYYCRCHSGYLGKNCEVDINECESSPCKNMGTCLEKSNMTLYHPSIVAKLNVTLPVAFHKVFDYREAAGYACLCVEGVTGPNCEININECESSPCLTGTCIDKIGGYECECDEGFEGLHCEIDIDECEKYQPCVHGTCSDRKANYYCDCDPLFGGKNCSVELMGCVQNPCANNGTCRPYLWNETEHKFNCSCSSGFHGDTCEKVTTMSFSGQSIVAVNTSREEGYDIQFRFKTTLGDGLLALGTGLTLYILEFSQGRLNLHCSLLNKWEGAFFGSNLTNGDWHKVFIAINATHFVLSANDEQTIYPVTYNENHNTTYTNFPTTYVGGIPSNLRKLTHGQPFLVGCVEDLFINGEWVLPEVQSLPTIDFQNVEVGCHRVPQCNPNPCHSGGQCTDKWRDFSCSCKRPYLGRTCQYNYTAATFGYENISNSLVTVTVADTARRAVRSIADISMFIRTRQSRGQIFYLGSAWSSSNLVDETFIAAQLEGGELLVRIQFNGTPEAYTVGGVKLNDGNNHLIEVIRNVTLVQVKLNGTEYFRKTISASGSLDVQVLFLGGHPQLRAVRQAADNGSAHVKADLTATTANAAAANTPLSMIHFKGVIQDVQISNGSKVMVVEFFPLDVEDLIIPMSFGTVSFDNTTVLEGVLSDNLCTFKPCEHNGECVNTWNDYYCNCTRGFKGKNCTELEFCELEHCPDGSRCNNLEDGYECIANSTFDGTTLPLVYSYIVYNESTKTEHFDTLELTYRTKSWGTALFAKYQRHHFLIFIYHDEVIVNWRIGDNAQSRSFKKDHFDGQWITLLFIIKESTLKGGFEDQVTDDTPNFTVDNFDGANFTEIFTKGVVYIAGSDNRTFDYWNFIENDLNAPYYLVGETTTDIAFTSNAVELPDNSFTTDSALRFYKADANKTSDLFKGCLGEIRIGNILFPFFSSPEVYPTRHYPKEIFSLQSEFTNEIGCRLCDDRDCFNQGKCIEPETTYKCECPPGFAADDCSIDINECETNECRNNATCIDKIARYECRCLPGFTGEFCEIDIDECESNPCQNGGNCTDLLAGYECLCPDSFIGKQCEIEKIVTCENNPCKNEATCKNDKNKETGNNFTCICTESFVGPLCENAYCLKKHCEAGYCNTSIPQPLCQCQSGFTGKYCEINIDDCILPTGEAPCQHGGVCLDGINRFDCNCTGTGYRGTLCETDIDECMQYSSLCGIGMCKNLPGTFECDCPRGSCGYGCEVFDPCQTAPCANGGVCEEKCTTEPDYICVCSEGWDGKNCTEVKVAAAQDPEGFNILYVVIPIVALILIILVIIAAVFINIARNKRATRGTYSPSAQEFSNPRVELDQVLKPPPEERLI